jgi:hypothetical protein
MPCAAAREALAAEPDGRHRDRTVRRHVRTCASCKAYGQGLRKDARSLRGFVPSPFGGVAGGSAIFGGLAVKTAITGGVLSQVTAACAVSVCAVGGFALLYPHTVGHHHAGRAPAPRTVARARVASAATSDPTSTAGTPGLLPAPADPAAPRTSGTSAAPDLAPARATKVISSASVVLARQFHLPGSTPPRTPTAASPPAVSPAPSSPTAAPTRPVFPAPTRGGGTPTGSPAGTGENPPSTSEGGGGSTAYTGAWSPTSTPTSGGTGHAGGDGSGSAGWGSGEDVSGPTAYPSSSYAGSGTGGSGTDGSGAGGSSGSGQSDGSGSAPSPDGGLPGFF